MRRRLLLALSLAACADHTAHRYEDPQRGFTIRFPEGFRATEDKGSAVFSRTTPDGRHLTVTVDAAPREVKGWSQRRSLDLATRAAKTMLASLPGAKLGADRSTTVGRYRGRILDVDFDHDFGEGPRRYRRRQWILETETSTHIGYVALTGPVERFAGGEVIAAAMLETFQLAGAAPGAAPSAAPSAKGAPGGGA